MMASVREQVVSPALPHRITIIYGEEKLREMGLPDTEIPYDVLLPCFDDMTQTRQLVPFHLDVLVCASEYYASRLIGQGESLPKKPSSAELDNLVSEEMRNNPTGYWTIQTAIGEVQLYRPTAVLLEDLGYPLRNVMAFRSCLYANKTVVLHATYDQLLELHIIADRLLSPSVLKLIDIRMQIMNVSGPEAWVIFEFFRIRGDEARAKLWWSQLKMQLRSAVRDTMIDFNILTRDDIKDLVTSQYVQSEEHELSRFLYRWAVVKLGISHRTRLRQMSNQERNALANELQIFNGMEILKEMRPFEMSDGDLLDPYDTSSAIYLESDRLASLGVQQRQERQCRYGYRFRVRDIGRLLKLPEVYCTMRLKVYGGDWMNEFHLVLRPDLVREHAEVALKLMETLAEKTHTILMEGYSDEKVVFLLDRRSIRSTNKRNFILRKGGVEYYAGGLEQNRTLIFGSAMAALHTTVIGNTVEYRLEIGRTDDARTDGSAIGYLADQAGWIAWQSQLREGPNHALKITFDGTNQDPLDNMSMSVEDVVSGEEDNQPAAQADQAVQVPLDDVELALEMPLPEMEDGVDLLEIGAVQNPPNQADQLNMPQAEDGGEGAEEDEPGIADQEVQLIPDDERDLQDKAVQVNFPLRDENLSDDDMDQLDN